ncbi:MAG: MFS transporter, partial [Nitrososphaerota archaeon]
ASLAQIQVPALTEKLGRKKLVLLGVFLQAITWIPIILLPYLFDISLAGKLLIVAVTFYALFNSLTGPPYISIISQYVPARKRGAYFSWRSSLTGLVVLVSTFMAGFILHLFQRRNLAEENKEGFLGFTIIFSIACIARFLTFYFIKKMYEPPLFPKEDAYFSFYAFVRRVKESNFVKFVLLASGMTFAVGLAGPFFSVYMLRGLKFSYLTYTLVNVAASVVSLLTLPTWGKHIDRVGNLQVIRLTTFLMPSVPILWLFSMSPIYLILANAFAGFVWAGYNLAVSNFILEAVSEEKRVRCLAYFNIFNGIGLFFGATLGGYLIPFLPRIRGHKILTIFLISGIMRYLVKAILLPKIREVRKVEPYTNWDLLFSLLGIKPITEK